MFCFVVDEVRDTRKNERIILDAMMSIQSPPLPLKNYANLKLFNDITKFKKDHQYSN